MFFTFFKIKKREIVDQDLDHIEEEVDQVQAEIIIGIVEDDYKKWLYIYLISLNLTVKSKH